MRTMDFTDLLTRLEATILTWMRLVALDVHNSQAMADVGCSKTLCFCFYHVSYAVMNVFISVGIA